jgi:hypothetical protein
MDECKPARLVRKTPDFAWDPDNEMFIVCWSETGECWAYTADRFCETIARGASCIRQSRIGGRLKADVIPFPVRDTAS